MTVRLDIGKVVFGAFVVPWRARNAFLRRLGLPLMALVALGLLWSNFPSDWPQWIGWVLALAYWAIFALFAVIVHRLVLVPDADRHRPASPRWTRREARFFISLLGVGALMAVVGAAVVFVPGTVLANLNLDAAVGLIPELARLPGMYVLGRLCLVFPAIALDRPVDLTWSWRLTKGHGARLFILVGLLPWVIAELGGLLFRADAGFFETLFRHSGSPHFMLRKLPSSPSATGSYCRPVPLTVHDASRPRAAIPERLSVRLQADAIPRYATCAYYLGVQDANRQVRAR